jgi:DNA-binding SARP family transcriptional activator/TolB-like protein/Tfp pilus assembly protein PilF
MTDILPQEKILNCVVPGANSHPVLRIGVIGGLTVSVDGSSLVLPNRKARAILAYLAMNENLEEQREKITGMFWSEFAENKARATLRQAVHETREALAALGSSALKAGRVFLALDPGTFELDIAGLVDGLTERFLPGELFARPRLAETVLAGYEDLDPAFHVWVLARRQTLHDGLLCALEKSYRDTRLSRLHRRRSAEAALLLDPAHEDACRMVMRAAAEDGEIAAALRAYDELYRLLGDDYDMEPSALTQELVANIKQGRFDTAEPVELLSAPRQTATLSPIRGPSEPCARTTPIQLDGAPRIAVLPFRTIGTNVMPAYLAEGMAEDIVCMLASLREPIVISSNSTRRYLNAAYDLGQVGHDLGARYLLSGAARRVGSKLRLSVELVESPTGAVLWGRVYDAQDAMFFEVQDHIVGQIVNTLAPRVHEAERRRIRSRRPDDLTAYHLVLEARSQYLQLAPESFERAGLLLRRAIECEPEYAAAHAAYAAWYSLRLGQGWSADPSADARALEQSAAAAIDLDRGNAKALALLGHNRTIRGRNYISAMALFDRALSASPNDAEAWLWSSPSFAYAGDGVSAVQRAEHALWLSPQDQFLFRTYHILCLAHYVCGSFEEAARWARLSVEENPRYTSSLRMAAASLVAIGRSAEARLLAHKVMELQPTFRVGALVEILPFCEEAERILFGHRLVEAGLPG